MSPLFLIAPAAAAAVLAYLLTPMAGWLSEKVGAIDYPGERKIHQVPIPRLGGLAVIAAIAVIAIATRRWQAGLPTEFSIGLALGLAPVLIVSIIDDVRRLPAVVKFLAQGIGAAIAVWYGFTLGGSIHVLGYEIGIARVVMPISWLWIVGVTNAFNLSDGLDGLSAGLALISAISLAAVAIVTHDVPQSILSATVVGALIGFLPYNTFPAKIFFGDSGAASIGFILACLGLWGTSRISTGIAVLVPILVMGVPIADALVTIGRRSMKPLLAHGNGDLFQPDQEHIHHKLLRRGLEHKDAVLFLYALGFAAAAIGVFSMFLTAQKAAIVVVTLLIAATLGIRELDYDEFAIVKNGLMLRFYEIPALRTGVFRVFIDMALVAFSAYAAFGLKYDDWQLNTYRQLALNRIIILAPVTLLVFIAAGLYRRSWRHSSLKDLLRSAFAVGVASASGLAISGLALRQRPSISYFIIYTMLLGLGILAVRSSFRVLVLWKGREKRDGARVLVYGSDLEGALALQELFWNDSSSLQPVGFIDDDPKNAGRLVNGFRVAGGLDALSTALRENHVNGLVIGSNQIAADNIARAREICDAAGVWVKRFRIELHALPTGELAEDRTVTVAAVAPVAVLDHHMIDIPSPQPVPSLVLFDEHTDSQSCPDCRRGTVWRSRSQSPLERFRKRFTPKRLYRCGECGWRGWLLPMEPGHRSPLDPPGMPDLASLDSVIQPPSPPRPPALS